MTNQKGFTLIELMIVVAIIGILASVAVPQYQDYVARSKVGEVYTSSSAAKTILADYHSLEGKMPAAGSDEDTAIELLITTSKYVKTAAYVPDGSDVDIAVLTVTFNDTVTKALTAGSADVLTITYDGGGVIFGIDCKTSTTVPAKYLPKVCL